MQIVILPNGNVKCLYGEELDLHVLGQLSIERGSYVEPTLEGEWTADLSPVGGPLLGPFLKRSDALQAERDWLENHWLVSPPPHQTSLSQEGKPHAVVPQENHGAAQDAAGSQCRD